MTRLINIDNGGTLTDFCLVEDGEVRYTKTLTTPYDLSRCLFDGLTKVSELAYSEPRLAAPKGPPRLYCGLTPDARPSLFPRST